jgi:very-short-patch-repair endonuclease
MYRKKIRYWLGKHHSEETIEKIKKARSIQIPTWVGKKRSLKYKKLVSKQVTELWKNSEYRQHMSEAHKHYTQEQIKNIMTRRIPNKQEVYLNEILQLNFPGEWKYVGDGSFVIDGKNPDFININGKKAIIELFGEFWHEKEEEQTRTDLFSKYGYSTLIIWSAELRKKLFIKKIRLFLDNLK